MIINKYNAITDGNGTISTSSGSGAGSSVNLSRYLWGNLDEGGNINGAMNVQGDIIVNGVDDDGFGNVIASGEIKGGEIYGEIGYINFPDENGSKRNVATLINSQSTQISYLQQTIGNHTNQLTELREALAQSGSSELITEQWVNSLIDNKLKGSLYHPVILYAGKIRRSTVGGSQYYIADHRNGDDFSIRAQVTDGLMTVTITPTEGKQVNVIAANVTQYSSGETADLTETNMHANGNGSHWFSATFDSQTSTNYVYIREFHLYTGASGVWRSSNWLENMGVNGINLTLFGYITDGNSHNAPSIELTDEQIEQQLKNEGLILPPLTPDE